ncbi:glycosylhydrolase [Klebsiella phage T751]|nr:tailspike protein [Klebsiella phage K751]URG13725.1 glycosylhydrolase [Klebsiella phage T751]
MANKPTKPNFPLGLESQDQSVFQEGILNNGVVEHGPDAVMTVPETPDASGVPSAVRYNEDDDQFEGYYNEGGWLPLGGGNGGRWELLPYASSTLLQAGRAYLVDNTDGVSTVLFPSPKRIGDSVTVCDLYGKFSTYPLTVDGNGKSIYGSADSMTISTDNVSATFTWTGEARGWVITSGVGLGQGRVYSREIYSQILSATTPSIILSTQPSIVDVYVDGKRLKESLYTLDGYEVKFDPALASDSDVQIIQYIPIQLGAGGGGSGGTVITWEYNGGSAIGGETQIVLDVVVDSVSEIYIRGQRQQIGRGFTFDAATSTITLADELETGDDVVVIINGDPTVYNQIDRTPWEVARANNVSNAEVILSTDKQTALDGKTILYDVVTQISWGVPEGVPVGAKISNVSSGVLTYNPGGISVNLLELVNRKNIRELWKRSLAELDVTLVAGSFEEGGTVTNAKEALWFQAAGICYTWGGTFNKSVAAKSTPASTGGVNPASWSPVTDSLYSMLSAASGAALIGGLSFVNPQMFGGVGSTTIDNTDAVQAAAAAAEARGCELNLIGGPWRITKTIDMTNIRRVSTDISGRFLVDPTNFTAKHTNGYVITWGNPDTAYGTERCNHNVLVGTLLVTADNRTNSLHGIFVKGALLNFGAMRAVGFNGFGIRLGATWDSTFLSLSTELCGNTTDYALSVDPFGDTSNCLNIGRIQCERAYHKQMRINVIRSEIHNIHAERMYILTLNDGATSLPSGLTYENSYFLLSNSAVYQGVIDALESSAIGTVTTTPSVRLSLYASSAVALGLGTCIVTTTYGQTSTIDSTTFYKYYNPGYPVTLTSCRMISTETNDGLALLGGSGITMINCVMDIIQPDYSTSKLVLRGCTINRDLSNTRTGVSGVLFDACVFGGSIRETGPTDSNEPMKFLNCTIKGTFVGSYQHRCVMEGGWVASINLASRSFAKFINVRSASFNYTGDRGFITRGCEIENVIAWGTPGFGSYKVGERTQRCGAMVSGNGIEFINTTNNGASFVAITSLP